MATNKGRKRRGWLWFLLGAGVLGLIALILVIILIVVITRPGGGPGPGGPTSPSKTTPRPTAQPADCPDVFVLVVPGTWESTPDDNPENPTSKPRSLMLRVSKALKADFPGSRADVWTTNYIAEFANPLTIPPDGQKSYVESRNQGIARSRDKLAKVHAHCPLTNYVLMGFSQGAMITGNIASDIGNGRGPVPADQVLGVTVIADSRHQPGTANNVGNSPPKSSGPEVAYGMIPVPGISPQGARPGGFGELKSRTYSICAPGDLVCDAPEVIDPFGAIGKLAGAINNPVHGMYATTKYWRSKSGQSATQWTTAWAQKLIENAPRPAHK